jgi:hypothetical protein
MAPGEGFEPSRPQRTTGFASSTPGLGSSTWDLPRTRLGNPGVSQPDVSVVEQLLLNRHKRFILLAAIRHQTKVGFPAEAADGL